MRRNAQLMETRISVAFHRALFTLLVLSPPSGYRFQLSGLCCLCSGSWSHCVRMLLLDYAKQEEEKRSDLNMKIQLTIPQKLN